MKSDCEKEVASLKFQVLQLTYLLELCKIVHSSLKTEEVLRLAVSAFVDFWMSPFVAVCDYRVLASSSEVLVGESVDKMLKGVEGELVEGGFAEVEFRSPLDFLGKRGKIYCQSFTAGSSEYTFLVVEGGLITADERSVSVLRDVCGFLEQALKNARAFGDKEEEAARDPLTGLYNRRALIRFLEMEVERARRSGDGFVFLMLDVDDFKRVNDTYGHIYGDLVLKKVAARIKRCVRSADVVGRYGGEEFGVILVETDVRKGREVGERIRREVEELEFEKEGEVFSVTVSVGGAVFPRDGTDIETIIMNADTALYQAKLNGKNQVVFS